MRLNKFVALATGMSRRTADSVITEQRVSVNNKIAQLGQDVKPDDTVTIDNQPITPPVKALTIMLNKPVGYVCSRHGQGSKTVYDLLPKELHGLKPVGRLDKDSTGLLLLTNDGKLANQLTHPSFQKSKVYEVSLDKPLRVADKQKIETGVHLEDGISKLGLQELETSKEKLAEQQGKLVPNSYFLVTMTEGKNRQIRRTFEKLGYRVKILHRVAFGSYHIGNIEPGKWQDCS